MANGQQSPALSERQVQAALDVITQVPGSILVRRAEGWRGLPPGTVGQVLKIGVDGMPGWYGVNEVPS